MRDKYTYILDSIKEGNENIQILCTNPEAYDHWYIKYESYLPDISIGLNRYFQYFKNHCREAK